ncbi:MAG: GAF domain-containing protein [Erythrobacteraceae bacterium]|nr:GAF domain-containing protein [Erythrobacteraceae bacterium]
MTSTFIKAVEIWVPNAARTKLTLKTGYYGELDYFERISRGMQFAYDEGLPGKCWAAGHPLMLKDLGNSYFKRGEEAMTVGLTSATAIPHFNGNDLTAVTVLFCGDNAHHVGAIELWHAPAGEPQMALYDGYFGRAEKFKFSARHTQFSRKIGLPGIVWDSGLPLIMEDLGRSEAFLRRDDAAKIGIGRGVGIPVSTRGPDHWVLVLLSAQSSPIAQRFTLWLPDEIKGTYAFGGGYCESGTDLAAEFRKITHPLDVGLLGEARTSRTPSLTKSDAAGPGMHAADLVLPCMQGEALSALLELKF